MRPDDFGDRGERLERSEEDSELVDATGWALMDEVESVSGDTGDRGVEEDDRSVAVGDLLGDRDLPMLLLQHAEQEAGDIFAPEGIVVDRHVDDDVVGEQVSRSRDLFRLQDREGGAVHVIEIGHRITAAAAINTKPTT